jgi:RimJ/RimL family protein N-acetyltransferase
VVFGNTADVGGKDFDGAKVRLRAIEPEEWEVFFEFDQDTDLARLGGYSHIPASRASTRQWAQDASQRKDGDHAFLAIETLGGTVVGSVSVARTERRNGLFTYGVAIGREYWRKGYGSEAVLGYRGAPN